MFRGEAWLDCISAVGREGRVSGRRNFSGKASRGRLA